MTSHDDMNALIRDAARGGNRPEPVPGDDMNERLRAATGRVPDPEAQRRADDEAWRHRVRVALEAREREVARLRDQLAADTPADEPVPDFDGGARESPPLPPDPNDELRAMHAAVRTSRAAAADDLIGGTS